MRRSPVFQQLSMEALRLLAFSSEGWILRPGDVLYRNGERSECAYLVLQGSVDLKIAESSVGDATPLSRRAKPGDLLGERALFVESDRQGDAIATAATKVLKISRSVFLRVLEEYPDAAAALHERVSHTLGHFVDELLTMRDPKASA